jgi:hypothetical protein
MVDPLSVGGAGAVKALQSATEGLTKAAGELLVRMFGPAADQIGAYLEQKAYYRFNNAQRIAEKAQRKATELGKEDGNISQRLSYVMLEDGTYSDDELMAEYLGGVLAAGRSPSGKDDRGVTWTKLVTSMSSLQLRAHFVLYREWAYALHGKSDINLGTARERGEMYVELSDFIDILRELTPEVGFDAVVQHILSGLSRFDLIADDYSAGAAGYLRERGGSYIPDEVPFQQIFRAIPSIAGLELYGWAVGLPGVDPEEFVTLPEMIDFDVEIRRPRVVLLTYSQLTSARTQRCNKGAGVPKNAKGGRAKMPSHLRGG